LQLLARDIRDDPIETDAFKRIEPIGHETTDIIDAGLPIADVEGDDLAFMRRMIGNPERNPIRAVMDFIIDTVRRLRFDLLRLVSAALNFAKLFLDDLVCCLNGDHIFYLVDIIIRRVRDLSRESRYDFGGFSGIPSVIPPIPLMPYLLRSTFGEMEGLVDERMQRNGIVVRASHVNVEEIGKVEIGVVQMPVDVYDVGIVECLSDRLMRKDDAPGRGANAVVLVIIDRPPMDLSEPHPKISIRRKAIVIAHDEDLLSSQFFDERRQISLIAKSDVAKDVAGIAFLHAVVVILDDGRIMVFYSAERPSFER
jgi:hypothetical protein